MKTKPQESSHGDADAAVAAGSYGQRMLNRMMKKTSQGEQLEILKKEYAELSLENSSLKERIDELETKVLILFYYLIYWRLNNFKPVKRQQNEEDVRFNFFFLIED